MRYYTWMENDSNLQRFGVPYALFRVEVSSGRIITDWWNPEINRWEHHPGLIAVTRYDGTKDYREVASQDIESIKNIISEEWSIGCI